jgi:hypothetical protein
MRGIAVAALCVSALALVCLARPARAGGYGAEYVFYGHGCCSNSVIHRAPYLPPRAYYVARPYRVVRPHRVVRFSEFDYYSRYPKYLPGCCYWHEVPIRIPRGWAWGVKVNCY